MFNQDFDLTCETHIIDKSIILMSEQRRLKAESPPPLNNFKPKDLTCVHKMGSRMQ